SIRRRAASTLTATGNCAPRTFSNSSAGPSVRTSRLAISLTSHAQSTSRRTRLRSPRRSSSRTKSERVRTPVIATPARARCGARARGRPSLHLLRTPPPAGPLAEQREQLAGEAGDEIVERPGVAIPRRRDRHDDRAGAREPEPVLERDRGERRLAHAHDEADLLLERDRGRAGDQRV